MFQFSNIVYAFIISLMIICISYFISELLLKIFNNGERKNVASFWKFYFGLFMLTSIVAIVYTKGLTILIPVPFLIIFLILRVKSDKPFEAIVNKKGLFWVGIVSFIVQFFIYLFFIAYTGNENIKYISGDFGIYYRSAERIINTGVETNLFTYPAPSTGGITPYHYGDLWLYGFASKFIKTNPSLVFLISFTVLSFVFTMGVYQIAISKFSSFSLKQSWAFIFIFTGLFCGFRVFFPFFILPNAEAYTLAIFNWGKVLTLSTSLVAIVLVADSKKLSWIIILTVIAGLFYINSIPALFTTLFLFILLKTFKKEISIKKFLKYLIYFGLGTIVYLVILYKLVPKFFGISSITTSSPFNILNSFLSLKYAKTLFNIFVGGCFQLFTILPYLLILILGVTIMIKKNGIKILFKSNFDTIIYLVLLFISSLFCWAFLHPISVDTVQFFHNILAPLYSISIALIIMYLFYVLKNRLISLVISAIALLSVYICISNDPFYVSNFNANEWEKIKKFYLNDYTEDEHFVNIQPIKNYANWSSKKSDMYVPLNILTYLFNNYHNVALVAPFIPVSQTNLYKNEELSDIKNATFSQYYFPKMKKGFSTEEITLKFIKDYNAKYIFVISDTTLPEYLNSQIEDSLNLTESNTKIFKLK